MIKRILTAATLLWAGIAGAAQVCGPANVVGTSALACWSEASDFRVVIAAKNDADEAQQWEPVKASTPGWYRLRNKKSGRCVGVRAATIQSPSEVVQTRPCTQSVFVTGDEWKFRRLTGLTHHKIQSRLGTLVAGANTPLAAGSVVDMYTDVDSTLQDWRLIEYVNLARPTDSAVRTTTSATSPQLLSGGLVSPSTEVDLSDCLGLMCKVAGSSPARYAVAKSYTPGMGFSETTSVAIEETTPAINTWTGGIVTAAFTGLPNSGPITATSNQVITGLNISNPNGTCIIIPDGVTNVTVRGNNIGPCERVALNNGDGAGLGVHIRGGSGHTVEANYFHDMAAAVMAQGTGLHQIRRNKLHNLYGGNTTVGGNRYLPGIQFNAMTGAAGRSLVACNVMDASTWNVTTTSTRPGIEDGFSTNGSSNVTYRYNYLRGSVAAGYNSATGSCISLGDDGGNNNQARDNICVKTPNNGVFTAGGQNHIIENNKTYNVGTSGSNTMLSAGVGEFQGQSSSNVLVRGNVGVATQWKNGLTGSQDAWSSFWTWVSGRDATPNLSVDDLVMYGNNYRDSSLTEAGVWGTTYSACAGTAAIPSGDIAYPQVAQTIPLQSTITASTVPYPRFAPASFQGKVKFELFNNDWASSGNGGNNTINNAPGWSQAVGLEGMQPNHTVNVRLKWSYPQSYAGQEVLNFPGFGEGRQAATSAATPQAGAKLPAQISTISSYRTGYASAAGPMSGPAHLSYDLWVGDTPTTSHATGTVAAGDYNPHRDAEIMMPRRISRAYGVPNTPAGAAAGRGCANLDTAATTCGGRNPNTWVERATIAGEQWDVYHGLPFPLPWRASAAVAAGQRVAAMQLVGGQPAWNKNGYVYTASGACTNAAGTPTFPTTVGATFTSGSCTYTTGRSYWDLPWHFIVFQPLSAPGVNGDTKDWKPFLDYIGAKGWISGWTSKYLNAMEIGVEPINPKSYDLATGGTTGDIQIMGFWTELNGARY